MKCLILFFFILLTFPLLSQEKTSSFSFESASLKEVLNKLESQFDVRFSYRNDIANQYTYSFEVSDASLDVIIDRLQQESQLIFDKISSRYIIVTEDKIPSLITIGGRLVEKMTQRPLWGGTIINQTQNKGCISDKEGYFELKENTLNDTIVIQYIGFTSVKFIADAIRNNASIQIELRESNEQLDEVLIDQISDRAGNNYDGSIILSAEDIRSVSASPDPDVFESLQLLPGIVSPSESSTDLYIRGGTPDQNLILWNGITIYHNSHFFGMISSLNPQQISEVKIFRSGASAQYGNRISGVIDLRSDRRIPEKVGGSLGANLTHMDALLKFPIMKDKVGVSVSFRRSYNDFINTPTFNEYSNFVFQNTSLSKDKASEFNYLNADLNFYFQDLALNTTFNFSDNHKLTLNYLYSLNDLDFSFFLDDSFKWKNRLRVNNKGFSVVSEGWWNQHIRHSIKAEFSNYEFDYYFQGLIDSDDRNKELRQNAIENLGLDADVQIRLNSFSKLRAGLQVAIQKVDYKLQGRFNGLDNYVDIKIKGKEDSFALYSELQLKYPKSIYVNLGLRLNYLTSKGTFYLEPRLCTKLKLTKPFAMKLLASVKTQNISQIIEFHTNDFGLGNQIWGLASDMSIPILQSKQVSGGIEWNKGGLNISLETYFKQDVGLTSDSKAFVNTNINNSLDYSEGSNKSRGIDAFVKKSGKNYTALLSYSLIKSKYSFPYLNEGRTFRGNFDIRHALTAAVTYHWQSFECSLNWKWRTGKPYTPVDSVDTEIAQIDYGEINSCQLPIYQRLDFSSAYTFNLSDSHKRQLKLGFSLQNVYNKKNVLDKSYILYYDDKHRIKEIKKYSIGIAPNIFVRMKF